LTSFLRSYRQEYNSNIKFHSQWPMAWFLLLPVYYTLCFFVTHRLRNDLYCVGWGVKLYSNQTHTIVAPFDYGVLFSQIMFRRFLSTTKSKARPKNKNSAFDACTASSVDEFEKRKNTWQVRRSTNAAIKYKMPYYGYQIPIII